MSTRQKTVILIAIFSSLLGACATVTEEMLRPDGEILTRILPLQVHVDDPNIKKKDLSGRVEHLIPEQRIAEAKNIIRSDFNDNIFQKDGGLIYGRAIVRVERKAWVNWTWFLPSTLTLYTINLIGFPIGSQVAEVTLYVEITDLAGNRVAHYKACGKDTCYASAWFGYGVGGSGNVRFNNALNQVVNARALMEALDNFKDEISLEAEEINEELMKRQPKGKT